MLTQIFRSYISAHKIELKQDKTDEIIEEMAALYQDPKGAVVEIKGNKDQLNQASELAMERQIVEHMLAEAKVVDKPSTFDEVVNQNQG